MLCFSIKEESLACNNLSKHCQCALCGCHGKQQIHGTMCFTNNDKK